MKENSPASISRRQFSQRSVLAASALALPTFVPSRVFGANEWLNVAGIHGLLAVAFSLGCVGSVRSEHWRKIGLMSFGFRVITRVVFVAIPTRHPRR